MKAINDNDLQELNELLKEFNGTMNEYLHVSHLLPEKLLIEVSKANLLYIEELNKRELA